MTQATKKKFVAKEVLEDYPEPRDDQEIVRIVCPRGNNLHEAEWVNGEKHLVSMPTKFRKSVWIKRGDFVIVEPITEGDKVKAEIIHILFPDQIKELKRNKQWPEVFAKSEELRKHNHDNGILKDTADEDEPYEQKTDLGFKTDMGDLGIEEEEDEVEDEEPQMDEFGNIIGQDDDERKETDDEDED